MAIFAVAALACAVAAPAEAAKKKEGSNSDLGGLYQPAMPLPDSVAERDAASASVTAAVLASEKRVEAKKGSARHPDPAPATAVPARATYSVKPIAAMRFPSLFQ